MLAPGPMRHLTFASITKASAAFAAPVVVKFKELG
jgi:hypothetical protein